MTLERDMRARLAALVDPAYRAQITRLVATSAPLLGVRQVCVIGHGRSSPRAIATGVRLAARFARERLVARLEDSLQGAGPGAAARTRR